MKLLIKVLKAPEETHIVKQNSKIKMNQQKDKRRNLFYFENPLFIRANKVFHDKQQENKKGGKEVTFFRGLQFLHEK